MLSLHHLSFDLKSALFDFVGHTWLEAHPGRGGYGFVMIDLKIVLSNPTITNFVLAVNSSSSESITIRMLDATGKLLELIENLRAEQLVKVGSQSPQVFIFQKYCRVETEKW